MHCFFAILAAFLLPILASAEPIEIPGPDGSLEAELIRVPHAAHVVVIIPGSGPIDRDGNAPLVGLSSDTYRLLAEGLEGAGIASVRIDKRGFFGSASAIADPNNVTIAAYAGDANNWVARAAQIAPCVWLAGHSEGGLVALVAAQTASDALCGLILMAAPGRPVGQLMIEQFRGNPANASLLPELESIVADLEVGRLRDPLSVNPILQPLFSEGLQRYMVDLFSYDPIQLAKGWQGQTIILQGDADLQVTTEDAELLKDAMPQAKLSVLKNVTHMLKSGVAGNPVATYRDPSLPVNEEVIAEIASFVGLPR